MFSELEFRREVFLSFQRALWDMVTPSLRGIAVRPEYPVIRGRFIYEAVGPEEDEIVAEVGTYVVADFLPPVYPDFVAVAVPPSEPRNLEPEEHWVYLRRESQQTGNLRELWS